MAQQQVQVSKQQQGQMAMEAQLLLETTQSCIDSIRTLGNMYAEKLKKSSSKNNNTGSTTSNNDGSDDTDMKTSSNNKSKSSDAGAPSDKKIFRQQMMTGQLLNCLRISVSDPKVQKNGYATELSMLEFGNFKKELASSNAPQVIMDKLMPFVDTMQVTLQDYKQSFVVPGPKLNPLLCFA